MKNDNIKNDNYYDTIMPFQPIINVGVLGHVAHGKSTIVRQITGIKTQKHANEQKTGRTLKLGYANIKIYKCTICQYFITRPSANQNEPECPKKCFEKSSEKCPEKSSEKCVDKTMKLVNHISFVDAPGHEFLMTTMLNGSAVMDCAILVIAGNEKVPQPQTQEHLIATQIMDLNNIIFVQNKLDLITKEEALENYDTIKVWLKGTCVEQRPIIPISAYNGHNVQRIIQALAEIRPCRQKRNPDKMPIFACIRSFDINKPGDSLVDLKGGVLGGTLLEGTLNVGDQIQILPGFILPNDLNSSDSNDEKTYQPMTCTLMSIKSENNTLNSVIPGGLIALCTDIDPHLAGHDMLVGSLIGKPGHLPPAETSITIKYFIFNTVKHLIKTLKTNQPIKITYLSRTITGKITNVAKKNIITVQLDEPVFIYDGCDKMSLLCEIQNQWKLFAVGKTINSSSNNTSSNQSNSNNTSSNDSSSNDLLSNVSSSNASSNASSNDFGSGLLPYTELLDQIADTCCLRKTQKRNSINIVPPEVQRQGGKRTLFKNFGTIAQSVGKTVEHFRRFISCEFATTADINEQNELLLYGIFNEGQFESLIRKYVREYCKCHECNCYITKLDEDARYDIITCLYCGRSRSLLKNKAHI